VHAYNKHRTPRTITVFRRANNSSSLDHSSVEKIKLNSVTKSRNQQTKKYVERTDLTSSTYKAMEESTGPATSSNNFVTSTQVVVVRIESPRAFYSDEVLRSFVRLANVVSRTVDSGV